MTEQGAYEAGKDDERKRIVEFLKQESQKCRGASTKCFNQYGYDETVRTLDAMGVAVYEVAVQIERGAHDA